MILHRLSPTSKLLTFCEYAFTDSATMFFDSLDDFPKCDPKYHGYARWGESIELGKTFHDIWFLACDVKNRQLLKLSSGSSYIIKAKSEYTNEILAMREQYIRCSHFSEVIQNMIREDRCMLSESETGDILSQANIERDKIQLLMISRWTGSHVYNPALYDTYAENIINTMFEIYY